MKLDVPSDLIDDCRQIAHQIALDIEKDISPLSTFSVERAILRLLGVQGEEDKVPYANLIIDILKKEKALEEGALYWIANATLATGQSVEELAPKIIDGSLNLVKLPRADFSEIEKKANELTISSLCNLFALKEKRMQFKERYPDSLNPLLYVIVASGNIYDDIAQAKAACLEGADCVAVIRSTAQSLLDYVPEGITTEGYGGTFATQANYRLMRQALDETSSSVSRYLYQVNYCSGLCMAEIAALAIMEQLDIMVNDALYGILFRDLNMYRTMIDQHFSRYLLGLFDIIITTGEDNLIKVVDAFEEYHIVLVSQFINEQLAKGAGMPENLIGLGHAAELDPSLEDSFLWELTQAQLVRQTFPNSPVKFMPPTRFKTGNIFFAHVLDTLFNLISVWTDQRIALLGMPTEALHTPYIMDRYLSLESAFHLRRAASSLKNELEFKPDGKAEERARQIVKNCHQMLEEIAGMGIWNALSMGLFSHIKRSKTGGRGYEGVFKKGKYYLNPFFDREIVAEAERRAHVSSR